jgi:hypothetical protein
LQQVAHARWQRGWRGLQLGRHGNGGLRRQQVGIARPARAQRGLAAHLLDDGQQVVGGDDDARLQVVQLVLQLVRLVQRPAGADDGADLLDA